MQSRKLKNVRSFFQKKIDRLVNIIRKPVKCGSFKTGFPTMVIICDPTNRQNNHLENSITYLADCYNLVVFLPEGCSDFTNFDKGKCWRIYNLHRDDFSRRQKLGLSTILLTLPDVECVLIDYSVDRHFMKFLWKNKKATIVFVNKNQLMTEKSINRVLAFSTRVIYDSPETFNLALITKLWAFPDSVDTLSPPHRQQPHAIENYVGKIVVLAKKAQIQLVQEFEDARFLAHSPDFDISYWTGKNKYFSSRFHCARRYIRDYKSGASAARPRAGFHPGIYAEHHDLGEKRVDPFVHYLKSEKPHGIWDWTVLGLPSVYTAKMTSEKIALHIHVYYPDMLGEILKKLQANQVRPDLFISIKAECDRVDVEQTLAGYEGKIVIKVVPNRGRDIGPLLTEFGAELVQNYDIIGHLHTKKSLHIKSRKSVDKWNNFLLTNLLGDGDKLNMADAILDHMQSYAKTALIFPDDRYAVGWASNYQTGREIAERLHIAKLPKYVVFPTGTMFWAKAEILKPFVDLGFSWQDYPEEPLPIDGTMLHAIERMFALICYQRGLTIATTYLPWTKR